MDLFQIVNNELVPSTHALMIDPFKTLWEEDDTENKKYAKEIFMYVDLLCNPKKSNPFAGYLESERPAKVKKKVFGSETPDIPQQEVQDIIYCIHEYREQLKASSTSYGLYTDAAFAVEKMRLFFRSFDFDERTNSGGLVLKPREVAVTLVELDEIDDNLIKLRDKVHGELTDTSKTRNLRKIGKYEE